VAARAILVSRAAVVVLRATPKGGENVSDSQPGRRRTWLIVAVIAVAVVIVALVIMVSGGAGGSGGGY
jgi:hypothetical protein